MERSRADEEVALLPGQTDPTRWPPTRVDGSRKNALMRRRA